MERSSKSGVWQYFKKKDKEYGQCCRCPKTLSCKGSSTSGLSKHLEKVHNIIIAQGQDHDKGEDVTPSTSSIVSTSILSSATSETKCSRIPLKKKKHEQLSIQKYFQQSPKHPEIVAELAAKDGISVRAITRSNFIRESLLQK